MDAALWYICPDALAVISAIRRRPNVQQHVKRYVITEDRWGEFTGGAIDRLEKIWRREGAEAIAVGASIGPCPQHVIGALWGDPNSSGYLTHMDTDPKWQAIRDNVAAALSVKAAA